MYRRSSDSLVPVEVVGVSVERVVERGVDPVGGQPGPHFPQALGKAGLQAGLIEHPVLVSWTTKTGE